MSQVLFYLLNEQQNKLTYACELIEKAYQKGRKLFIQCDDEQSAEAFDDLLWGFKPESFIPHNLQTEPVSPAPPVQIGYTDKAKGFHDILINLSETIVPFHEQFKLIVEIVDNEPDNKARLRQHYREYQALGHRLKTQKNSPQASNA